MMPECADLLLFLGVQLPFAVGVWALVVWGLVRLYRFVTEPRACSCWHCTDDGP